MKLTMLLDMAAQGFGDRVVVGPRRGGMTAADLRGRAIGGAGELLRRGAPALVYLAVNGPAYPVAMFASTYAGVPLVPLNYRLGSEQLAPLLDNHPGALVVADEAILPFVRGRGFEAMTPADWLEASATATEAGQEPTAPEPSTEATTAVVIYTSGTTSRPKGVLLKHDNLVSYVLGSVEFMNADADEAALVSVPPYHIAAVANVISNLYAGRRVIVLEQFRPEEWLDLVRHERVTNALVVPTMLARIIAAEGDTSVPTLRGLAYGGAPMPQVIIEQALALWPHVGFVNAYGLTETSSTVTVLGPEDHRAAAASDDPAVRARLGSVGRAVDSIDLEVRDVDGRHCAPGQVGRIFVRGPQVSAEYQGLGVALDADGFFDTRDEGYLDAEGYLFIGGRADDTIIRGGENIAPAEIEEILHRHPAVEDVAVVGVPDDEWGQRLEAAVVVRPGAVFDPESVREFVRSHLRSSKTPDRLHVVDALPRTDTGKLLRRRVIEGLTRLQAV